MKISIIVPFYNTNIRYFDRMIRSLNKQTFKNFETIIVDDGSNEGNAKLLDGFNYGDLCVKIIHQRNKGLSGARTTGIKNAIGEYVVFVDSDDVLPSEMLNEAYEYINMYNSPDVIFGRMVYSRENRGSVVKITRENCEKIDLDSFLMSQRQNFTQVQYYMGNEIEKVKIKLLHQDGESIILGSSSANVYKKSIVHNCLFDEDIRICEDQIFNRNILNIISTCLIIPNEWYDYVQYSTSMLHKQSLDVDLEKTFSYWDKIAQVDKIESQLVKHYSNIHNIGLLCDEVKKMALSRNGYRNCKEKIETLYRHEIIKSALEDQNLNYSSINKIKLFLFRNNFMKILFYIYTIRNIK